MRFYRITFVGGLAIGYVLGAQAGRERYEQLKHLARKAAESPAMQQTAGAFQAQAAATAKSAKDKASSGMRKSASKMSGRRSGNSRTSSATATMGNGSSARPAGSGDGRPFVPVNGSYGESEVT
ncbi:MAG TPA: hypothetical protein VNF47_16975 [Streptosporangiaceae bacterium]|nr:hypothetical protein [Streptosporangiaceae bacterium]